MTDTLSEELVKLCARAAFDATQGKLEIPYEHPWVQTPEEGEPNSLAEVYEAAMRAALAVAVPIVRAGEREACIQAVQGHLAELTARFASPT